MATALIFRIFDIIRGPRLFEIVWHIFTSVDALNEEEVNAGASVLGTGVFRYDAVRIAQGRLLSLIFRINHGVAFTAFHIINLPKSGNHSRQNLGIIVHELTHIFQFEQIGSLYIWQALRAQRTNGYEYGGWQQLKEDWINGKHLRDYNREQQGQIAQDYYREVVEKGLLIDAPIRQAYAPFITELRNGEL